LKKSQNLLLIAEYFCSRALVLTNRKWTSTL
ncbi:hypothetical protein T12_759, partial [Trichinella patagoniensis]